MPSFLVQPATHPRPAMPLGDARLDACLPGGLTLGAVHEVRAEGIEGETGALAATFAAMLLAGLPDREGPILWVATLCDLYGPGLLACGLDPGRLVIVASRNDAEALGAMELGLREGGMAAVLGEVGVLSRLAAHRLHLACLRHGVTCLVLRRTPYGIRTQVRDGTAVATRWQVAPAPSIPVEGEPGPARWRVTLLHARGGREGCWLLEAGDAPNRLRVVTELADTAPAGAGHAAGHG